MNYDDHLEAPIQRRYALEDELTDAVERESEELECAWLVDVWQLADLITVDDAYLDEPEEPVRDFVNDRLVDDGHEGGDALPTYEQAEAARLAALKQLRSSWEELDRAVERELDAR